ncbi:TonB-dependent receptor [Bacillus subtilis subsp. subtilis]|nr:TonB-dependent receptor [Bacillus subtilis subsp. subtilis]
MPFRPAAQSLAGLATFKESNVINTPKHRSIRFRTLPLTIAVMAAVYGTPAFAQTVDATPSDAQTPTAPAKATTAAPPEATRLDAVSVTGSLLRRADYATTSPVQTINVADSAAQGHANLAQVLQQSAIGAGSTQLTNQFGGFVVNGGLGVQTIGLRGLGSNRTLVLLNGQRPGPAGTRGAVGAVDLSLIPNAILQSIEIVKDGASSIYGSDAIAGAVNLITRRDIARPELTVEAHVPFDGGGEIFSASVLNGWEFDSGSIVAAADVFRQNSLTLGERPFLRCSRPLIKGHDGRSIDIQDRSVLAGTPLAGCYNHYINAIQEPGTSNAYVPSADGSTLGPFPGYRPENLTTYANGGTASSQAVYNYERYGEQDVITEAQRATLFASADFSLGGVNWKSQWLLSQRESSYNYWQQFFPTVTAPGTRFNLAQPVVPMNQRNSVDLTYFFTSNQFDGLIPGTDSWAWEVNANYSHSRGTYTSEGIATAKTGDRSRPGSGVAAANFLDPGFLSGARAAELPGLIGATDRGSTDYTQAVVSGLLTGNLFDVPAGTVGSAVGLEYRNYAIDDQPGPLSRSGGLWGQSTAQVTRGRDRVMEAFTEIEVPVLKGVPGIESLTLNGSGRVFKYDSVSGIDNVWKLGLSWQLNPVVRLRGGLGTSFRAPGLYELYLGGQTGFAAQQNVDPCIRWGRSDNEFLRANCAAMSIPENFTGAAESATVISGGGAGVLVPERSRAKSAGIVLTPTFADLNVALDYFDYDIRDEIALLSAGNVVGGCYAGRVFPNRFCDDVTRGPATDGVDSHAITAIHTRYLNINRNRVRGYDISISASHDLSVGSVGLETRATYTISSQEQLFDTAASEGRTINELVGSIGRPKLTATTDVSFQRGDWEAVWSASYVGSTENLEISPSFTYFGYEDAWRDIVADARWYHSASVTYNQSDWSVTLGLANVFNTAPPSVSSGVAQRYGTVPVDATQYNYLGRSGFVRATYRF